MGGGGFGVWGERQYLNGGTLESVGGERGGRGDTRVGGERGEGGDERERDFFFGQRVGGFFLTLESVGVKERGKGGTKGKGGEGG